MSDWKAEAKKNLETMKQARGVYAPVKCGSEYRMPAIAMSGAYVITGALPPRTGLVPVDLEFCKDLYATYSRLIARYVKKCNDRVEEERKQAGLFDEVAE